MRNRLLNKLLLLIACISTFAGNAVAQATAPWECDPHAYRYDMSLYLDFTFAGTPMDYSDYQIGIFAGDECRGIGEVIQYDGMAAPAIYLRARSNTEGEQLTFRYFNRNTSEILDVENVEVTFESDGRLGWPSAPYNVNIIIYKDVVVSAGDGGSATASESGRIPQGTVLTLSATSYEGMHFEQWSDGNTENPRTLTVEDDINLTAEFAKNPYTLTYSVDGDVVETQTVLFGEAVTPLAEPTKTGYTFSGWSEIPSVMPANDVEVSGSFTINSYTLTFRIGEEVIETRSVEYASAIATPEAPAKEGHTFAGWQNVPETMPAQDLTIEGSYTVNSYNVTYLVDGASYGEPQSVLYGEAVVPVEAPTRTGYTFSGWQNIPETMPAHDVEISGTFAINSYSLTFRIGEDVIETTTVKYNSPIAAPEAPAKEGHTFAGWQNVPETMPAQDLTIEGSYTVNSYNVTYTVDGVAYGEPQSVLYGEAVVTVEEPVKTGYTFSGWQNVPETMPAHDVEISGSFAINSYTLTFRIGEDVIETTTVEYNSPIAAPEAPYKEGHTFAGWQNVPETMPAQDLTITGSYTVNSYNVTYLVDGASYGEPQSVLYGEAVVPVEAPTRTGYTFSGWQNIPETMPAHDVEISGTFAINSYSLTFRIGEDVIETKSVEYASAITAPEAPAKEGHTFAGWQNAPETMPAQDLTITGSYTVNSYNVTYTVDGEPYGETQSVLYGETVVPVEAPVKTGYTFSGWQNVPETMPAHDVEISGSFAINSYTLTFRIGEDVIETTTVEYNSPIAAPEAPYKEGHTFAGWQNVPETMPAQDLTITGSYTVNSYNVTYTVDGEPYGETQSVLYGETVVPVEAPVKTGYTFSGWQNVPETMPAHDVEISGSFAINSYTLTFRIGEDVIETTTVEYNSPIAAPEAPAKEGHTFAGWQNVPETMPAQDLTIEGSYTVNSYTLTYVVDGETYEILEVEYGTVLELPAPEKEGYTFSGWDWIPETMPANDVTLNGSFSINSYTLTIYLDNEVYSTVEVEYGTALNVEIPEIPADREFEKWAEEIPETMPAHDLELHAITKLIVGVRAVIGQHEGGVDVYTIEGHLVSRDVDVRELDDLLAPGLYLINGKKILKR